MMRLTLLSVVVSSCIGSDCPPLADAPVLGDPHARPAVADALAGMANALALPVCVREVHLVDRLARDDIGGTWRATTETIRLDAGLSEDALVHGLRHEVCHAVDDQNGLVSGREAAFPFPGFDPEIGGAEAIPHEAFAETCAVGPGVLAAAWPSSTGGPATDIDAVGARFVHDEVYGLSDAPPGAELVRVATARPPGLRVDDPELGLALTGLVSGRIAVGVFGDGWGWFGEADPHTGELFDLVDAPETNPPPELDPALAPEGWTAYRTSRASDGSPVVYANLWLPAGNLYRWSVLRADGWRAVRVDPAARTVTPFSLDGAGWLGWVEGDHLAWGPFVTTDERR